MNWRKWLDGFALAGKGILLATREKRFWYGFIPSFIFFGILMNLFGAGDAKFSLIFAGQIHILGETILNGFLSLLGVNMFFWDWALIFLIALLQGTLIGLIVLLWNKKQSTNNSGNLGKAGILTALIAFGAGCPTCGAPILSALIGVFVSGSTFAIAGVLSSIFTVIAIIIAILSLKHLGEEVYVIIVNEKYLAKQKEKELHGKSRK